MAELGNFNLDGISFRQTKAAKITQPEWREIQDMERKAFLEGLNRRQTDIDHLLDWWSHQNYGQERVNPMLAVERGNLRDGQLITKPRVVLAYNNDEMPVGYAYLANNTSGNSQLQMRQKMLVPGKHYAWLREIAVHPSYQNRGIGLVIGYLALEKVKDTQPVSAYVWAENSSVLALAKGLGMQETDKTENQFPFGPGSTPATQIRLQGRPSEIRDNILAIPGAEEAIAFSHANAA